MKRLLCAFFIIFTSLAHADEYVKCPEGTRQFSEVKEGYTSIGCVKTDENGNDIKHGPFKSLHPNGQLYVTATYVEGKMDGEYEDRYNNGKTERKLTLKKEVWNGKFIKYHANGQIEEVSNYIDGNLDGPSETYYENGKAKKTCTYKNGLTVGLLSEFHNNGTKAAEGKYENGKPTGTWNTWDKKGKILAKGSFAEIVTAYKSYMKKLDEEENGIPLTKAVFSPCYSEQISSLKTGKGMKEAWIPKKGITFRADDQFYTIRTVLGNDPIQLLVEGPTQIDDTLKNACYIVLTIKNSSLLKAESTGKVATVGDSIHGFELKSIGTIKVGLQRLKDISQTDLTLPNFELLTTFGSAQSK